MTSTDSQRGLRFYTAAEARNLDEDGMMRGPDIPPEVYRNIDIRPVAAGSTVNVLFKGDGPDGWSLVHAHFKPGYRLPRHSHSADCLYFVLAGEIHMGNRTVVAGDGFLAPTGSPYAFEAGEEGAEVLEFRTSTDFDMKVLDRTVERWQPIVAAALANQARWAVDDAGASR